MARTGAALAPPPGLKSNLVDPQYHLLPWAVLSCSLNLVLCTVAVLARCWVRARQWAVDDCLLVIAWIFDVAFCVTEVNMMVSGGGTHTWNLTKAQAADAAQWYYDGTILYGFAMCFAKVAILLFFCRVFVVPQRQGFFIFRRNQLRQFDVVNLVVIAVIAVFYLVTVLLKIFASCPQHKSGRDVVVDDDNGNCISVAALLDASGAFNLATDVLILLIPVFPLWRLQASRRAKVKAYLLLTLGALAPVFAGCGMAARVQAAGAYDKTYKSHAIMLWAGAEICCAVVCACLPAANQLLSCHRPRPRRRQRRCRSASSGHTTVDTELASKPQRLVLPDGRDGPWPYRHSNDDDDAPLPSSSLLHDRSAPGAHVWEQRFGATHSSDASTTTASAAPSRSASQCSVREHEERPLQPPPPVILKTVTMTQVTQARQSDDDDDGYGTDSAWDTGTVLRGGGRGPGLE